jgi:hypothetical protein
VPSIVSKCVVLILLASSPLLAQVHGVYVGLNSSMIPPEFSQVSNTEYTAQFGIERIQVFVNGALVTGFNVIPLIPVTLAEAIAKYGSVSNTLHMFELLDLDGNPQGLVDPIKRVSYLTRDFGPEGIVSSIGFYDQNTALQIWTGYADPALLQALDTAVKKVSLENLTSRPRIAALDARARFMLQKSLKALPDAEAELEAQLRRYNASCADPMSSACQQAKQTQGQDLIAATQRLQFGLKQANSIYSTNADLFGETMPPDLARLNASAENLLKQVPLVLPVLPQ